VSDIFTNFYANFIVCTLLKDEIDKKLSPINNGVATIVSLSLLSIENDVTRQLPFDEIISEFAHKKCRKVNI
jgi:hypothetical protein